ncbi:alpha/beta-hydrolase [Wilcoxina mikolae CBS 423.85]|nr:alpha/beta-hydrolase [Wilcoxina mikolae CBS 423.85]
MSSNILTRFAFPGFPNRDPTPKLKYLPRAIGSGSIEYVPLITPGAKTLVFVCHGRLRALDSRSVNQWEELAGKEGVSVVLHNYPGYGGTIGPITEERLCQDAVQLAESVKEEGQELVLLGNSVGCGPTMWLAVKLGIKKVVVVSPYTSLVALAPYWVVLYLFKALSLAAPKAVVKYLSSPERLRFLQGKAWLDPFPPLYLAKKLEKGSEVLILHGELDSTVPVSHSQALVKELESVDGVKSRLCIIPDTEHKDTRVRGNAAIWSFFRGNGKELEKTMADLKKVGGATAENKVGAD